MWRISATVRFALSVVASMKIAARPVPLVGHLFVLHALQLPRALLDGTLDVVERHVLRFRRVDRGPEPGVARWIPAALLCRDGDFPDQLGEEGPAPRVGNGLLALDLLPLAVAGHGSTRYRLHVTRFTAGRPRATCDVGRGTCHARPKLQLDQGATPQLGYCAMHRPRGLLLGLILFAACGRTLAGGLWRPEEAEPLKEQQGP